MLSYLPAYGEYMRVVRGHQASTVKVYSDNVRQFVAWLEKKGMDTDPDAIVRGEIEAFMKALFFDYKITKNATRAQKLSALKSFFDYLVRDDILRMNPADEVPSPKVPKRMPMKFTKKQLALLFSSPGSDAWGIRDHAILKVLYAAGLRVSELTRLELEDMDDTGRYIRLLIHGKGAKQRVITLKANPAAALRKWIAFRLTMDTGHTAVFISGRHRTRLSSEAINAVLKKYAVKVGISEADAFVHKMRSTCFADIYDEAMDRCPHCGGSVSREDIFSLAAYAGHEDPKTMKDYIKISEKVQKSGLPDRRFTEIEKLANKLRGEGNE